MFSFLFLLLLLWFTDFDQAPPFLFFFIFISFHSLLLHFVSSASRPLHARCHRSVVCWPFPPLLPPSCLHDWVTLTKSETEIIKKKSWAKGKKKEKRRVARRHLHNESCVVDFITYSCTESTRLPIIPSLWFGSFFFPLDCLFFSLFSYHLAEEAQRWMDTNWRWFVSWLVVLAYTPDRESIDVSNVFLLKCNTFLCASDRRQRERERLRHLILKMISAAHTQTPHPSFAALTPAAPECVCVPW